MPYPGTIGLHALSGFLSLLSVLYLFSHRKRFFISPLRKYFSWFCVFVLYNAALILSAFLYEVSPWGAALGYLVALVFLTFAAWQGFMTAVELLPLARGKQQFLSAAYILGALLAVLLHAIYFETPRALNESWILWYPNQVVALPYILFMFFAGWTFCFTFARAFFLSSQALLKARTAFMAASGFILPFAAYFYFAASKLGDLYTAFWIVIAGLLTFVAGNIGVAILARQGR